MKAKKTKAQKTMAEKVADIPAEPTLADIIAELRRGFADVVYAIGKVDGAVGNVETAVKDRLESIRRIMFYIPAVADGVKASREKKEQSGKADEPSAKSSN